MFWIYLHSPALIPSLLCFTVFDPCSSTSHTQRSSETSLLPPHIFQRNTEPVQFSFYSGHSNLRWNLGTSPGSALV